MAVTWRLAARLRASPPFCALWPNRNLTHAQVDVRMRSSPESVSTLIQDGSSTVTPYKSDLQLQTCRKLCEDGLVSEAVDALDRLVLQGCHIPNNLLYRALRRCIEHKDLVLGRRVHALTVKSGYESNAFLANHLICMYSYLGSLIESMQVFSKVTAPDAYMWASIILAFAKHGQPTQAIGLYRRMHESTVKPDNHIFVAVLRACVSARDLAAGKEVHAHILASAVKPDIFVQNCLVDMYAKCGSLKDAHRVFVRLPQKDVLTWNAMLAGYVLQGMGQEALSLYSCMQQEGITDSNSFTFVCLLQACASVAALHQGRQLHAQIEERGLQADVVVGNSLVSMYAKCGSLEDAQRVFDRLPQKDVVTWNAMIAGYAQKGTGQEALNLYSRMQQEGMISPNSVTFICLLQACASLGVLALDQGKQLHAEIEEQGLQADVVVGASLLNMYGKCGSLEDAQRVFDRLSQKNVVTWTAMIAGYVQQGMGQEALTLYNSMQQEGITPPDSVTFVCLLQACASVGVAALHQGKQLHAQIEGGELQADVVVCSSLVNMYAKCGSLEDAQRVFDRLSQKDVVTWNAMMAGYAQQGRGQEVLSLYSSMQLEGITPPDSVTFVCLLQACASVGVAALNQGKQLHAQIEEHGLHCDVVVGNSLVNMYAKCESLEDAQRVFGRSLQKDVVTWNAMIGGYAQQGMGHEALSLYSYMQQNGVTQPDCVTFVCLLQACASVGMTALHQGRQVHAQIRQLGLEADVVVGASLVTMYARCGSLEDARRVFDGLSQKNVVTWNAMIAGYAQQRMGQETLSVYSDMQLAGISAPDSVTFVCLLQACAGVADLPLGKQLHAQIEARGLQGDVVVGNSLVNMYAKCGSMAESQQVFDSLPKRNGMAWGALIAGYSRQGDSEIVFDLLDKMRLEAVQPSGITFLSVLTVCSHVGLVDKGQKYFEVMIREYGITPTMEHYTCMMGLLGRAGRLDEALQMVKTMPFQPNGAVWRTLLAACQKWSDVEVGQQAFESAVILDSQDAASYVLMSNIYAGAQMWEEAREIQALRVKCKAWKEPGRSWWTDVGGILHSFGVEGKHPETDGIDASLSPNRRMGHRSKAEAACM